MMRWMHLMFLIVPGFGGVMNKLNNRRLFFAILFVFQIVTGFNNAFVNKYNNGLYDSQKLSYLRTFNLDSSQWLAPQQSTPSLNMQSNLNDTMKLKTKSMVSLIIPEIAAKQLGDQAYELVAGFAQQIGGAVSSQNETQRNLPITIALMKLQRNMDMLDNVAGRTPQLTRLELLVLFSTVAVSAAAPALFTLKIAEVLVPSMAAIAASIGLGAEYVGKVAVSKSKEIAALAIQAAAEAEVLLAAAERSKAILPLCVGIATTASALALLAPAVLEAFNERIVSVQLAPEALLLCPLIAVLAAAVAGLATQESRDYASRAAGLGNRRFASSKDVGRTWLSATEQVEASASRLNSKWWSFALGVLPAPIIAALCPGALSFKTIVCAAIAAAQAAYYLANAEYFLASAVEVVALKARSSAVADTYANQSSRAGAILPFTSALAGLCAAASAAIIEVLPMIKVVELQSMLALIFPAGAAMFAAAASVARAKCEVDSAAASIAASSGLSPDGDKQEDPVKVVKDHISISIKTTFLLVKTKSKQLFNALRTGKLWQKVGKWFSTSRQQLFRKYASKDKKGDVDKELSSLGTV